MSRSETNFDAKTKLLGYARAAGRCQHPSCNKDVTDSVTSRRKGENYGQGAHIKAASKGGPRFDPAASPKELKSLENFILLCPEHHKEIDSENGEDYSVEEICEWRDNHFQQISRAIDSIELEEWERVHITAPIAEKSNAISNQDSKRAILNFGGSLADKHPVEIDLTHSLHGKPWEVSFWKNALAGIQKQLHRTTQVMDANRIAFFGIAPQPVLVAATMLIGHGKTLQVFQFDRDQQSWALDKNDLQTLDLRTTVPAGGSGNQTLLIDLTAHVSNERVNEALGQPSQVWRITIDHPTPRCISTFSQLHELEECIYQMLDKIAAKNGIESPISVFLASPLCVAATLGKVWNANSHPPMIVYDQNADENGRRRFLRTLTISPELLF